MNSSEGGLIGWNVQGSDNSQFALNSLYPLPEVSAFREIVAATNPKLLDNLFVAAVDSYGVRERTAATDFYARIVAQGYLANPREFAQFRVGTKGGEVVFCPDTVFSPRSFAHYKSMSTLAIAKLWGVNARYTDMGNIDWDWRISFAHIRLAQLEALPAPMYLRHPALVAMPRDIVWDEEAERILASMDNPQSAAIWLLVANGDSAAFEHLARGNVSINDALVRCERYGITIQEAAESLMVGLENDLMDAIQN